MRGNASAHVYQSGDNLKFAGVSHLPYSSKAQTQAVSLGSKDLHTLNYLTIPKYFITTKENEKLIKTLKCFCTSEC